MKPGIVRESVELRAEGRTLLGLAFSWNAPVMARDLVTAPARALSTSPYLEAYAPGCCDETLRRNPAPRPLFTQHGHRRNEPPIGVVHFAREERGLLFRAHVSRTRAGDETLELVRDGAMTSASIGALPLRHRRVRWPEGEGVLRTEIALQELSLVPTGMGQRPEAKVLAMRGAALLDSPGAYLAMREREARRDDEVEATLVRAGAMSEAERITNNVRRQRQLGELRRRTGRTLR